MVAAAPLDPLYDAIVSGDTETAITEIPNLYEARGDFQLATASNLPGSILRMR